MRLFFAISVVVVFFRPFSFKMAVFLYFSEILARQPKFQKSKFPEYLDPPSQHYFVTKDFIHRFLSRRKVALCQSGRMAQLLKFNSDWMTLKLLKMH